MSQNRSPSSVNNEALSQVQIPVQGVIMGLAVVGGLIGVVGGTPRYIAATLPVALLVLLLAAAAWLLAGWRQAAGVWAVLAGLVATVLLLRFWLGIDGALVLLAIPATLGLLLLGHRGGSGVALICTLVAGWLGVTARVPALEIALALALVWLLALVYWFILRSVGQLVDWSLAHYSGAQIALDEVRANRAQLHQTLEDLGHANRQLGLMNRRLAAAQMAAEEAHKTKAAFVANVSHEFRTPLNMIIGLSDLLIEAPHVYGSQLPDELLEDLEIVQRNTQHLLAMVNDVLDLSQIEANRLALHRERVQPGEVVARAAAVVRPLLEKKGVELRLEVPPDLPDVYCDSNRVRQVLVNLLSNAARHTEQGHVTVDIAGSEHSVTFCVADTGPGIAPEDAAHIFEPFHRGTYGARSNENSSGLGLSISKQFIEMHNGRMWLESELGQGSAFSFSLPITTALPAPGEGAERWLVESWQWHERLQPANLPATSTRPRVVICDPHPDLCDAFTRFNDAAEYVRADSLASAEEIIAGFPVQMLVLNDASPRLLLEMLADARLRWPELPAIGCSLPPRLGHALAAGAAGQLLKPITRTELAGVVAQIQPRTVLVVDDDADTRRLFSRMLAAIDESLRVVTAANGREGLDQMRAEAPDLVLLDVKLPEMDGWQVLAAKALDDDLRAIPTFLLSAQDPADEPFSSQILIAAAGERTPFYKLLRCAEVIPLILNDS
ncbi:MAG: hybrid sensor histidine kinase/response regulator [Caldilineaceae bacterium]|nr:hybrid sensor histidine kinase/response regulator [Caldilineaceae bacterium]